MEPLDLSLVLKDAPPGAWVALSRDKKRIVGTGDSIKAATSQAHLAGENDPVFFWMPEASPAPQPSPSQPFGDGRLTQKLAEESGQAAPQSEPTTCQHCQQAVVDLDKHYCAASTVTTGVAPQPEQPSQPAGEKLPTPEECADPCPCRVTGKLHYTCKDEQPAGARELQHKANELLRRLSREVFEDGINIEQLPHAVGLVEDFARDWATQERERADAAERQLKSMGIHWNGALKGEDEALKHCRELEREVESLRTQLAELNRKDRSALESWADDLKKLESIRAELIDMTADRDKWKDAYNDLDLVGLREDLETRERELRDTREALRKLVEQFHAYENGWLDGKPENWRNRIGLQMDLQKAEALLSRKGEGS